METTTKKHSRRDWTNLNHDLLVLIASKVASYPDFLYFKEVCSSWRIASQGSNNKSSPMLVFFADRDDSSKDVVIQDNVYDDVQFININQKKPYKLFSTTCSVRQSIRYQKMVGSNPQGWVFMLDRYNEPYLVQLFSWTRFQLPLGISTSGIVKAVFSSNDSSHFVVVMMKHHDVDRDNDVAFWRTGDIKWTRLQGAKYIDVAMCDHKVYALRNNNGSVFVESLDFGIGSSSAGKKLRIKVPDLKYSKDVYVKLVCSSEGQILIVNCLKNKCVIWGVNVSEEECEEVDSLNGNSLIISDATCAFVLGSEVEEDGYKANSVYVVRKEHNPREYLIRRGVKRDIILSVYNLEGGKTEQLWKSKREKVAYCTRTQSYNPEPYMFGFIHGVF